MKFKAIALSLVTNNHFERTPQQRDEALTFITVLIQQISSKRKQEVILMPWGPFCLWFKENWNMNEEQLKEKWKQLRTGPSTAQYCEKDDEGRMCVPVKMPVKISLSEKQIQLNQMSKKMGITDEKHGMQQLGNFDKNFINKGIFGESGKTPSLSAGSGERAA